MNKSREIYKTPTLVEVSLVPEEAVLEVCKNHINAGDTAHDQNYCSWPGQYGGNGQTHPGVCKGVTGS